jgi:predicted nucleotidyltransferase
MTPAVQQDLEAIKAAIIAHTPVEAMYLFGSYAYGTPGPDSDLDVCAVIPDGEQDVIDLGTNIRYSLYKRTNLPFDLVISKKSVFDRRSRVPTLEREISQKGIAIYGKL